MRNFSIYLLSFFDIKIHVPVVYHKYLLIFAFKVFILHFIRLIYEVDFQFLYLKIFLDLTFFMVFLKYLIGNLEIDFYDVRVKVVFSYLLCWNLY
jgi:hypothetical protein